LLISCTGAPAQADKASNRITVQYLSNVFGKG
jgi:hypothetical protein